MPPPWSTHTPMSFLSLRSLAALAFCFCIGCGVALSTKQPKPAEVRLAVTRGGFVYLPVFVAGPAGCFNRQNLAVNIDETESATKSMTALLAGTVDAIAGGYLQALDLVAQDRPLRAFLVMQQFPGFVLAVSPRASKPIRTIEDLKGTTIGVASVGTESHRILNYVLRRHGIRPEDVSVIGLGSAMITMPGLSTVSNSAAETWSAATCGLSVTRSMPWHWVGRD